jgi:hypothetical protein
VQEEDVVWADPTHLGEVFSKLAAQEESRALSSIGPSRGSHFRGALWQVRQNRFSQRPVSLRHRAYRAQWGRGRANSAVARLVPIVVMVEVGVGVEQTPNPFVNAKDFPAYIETLKKDFEAGLAKQTSTTQAK